MSIIEQNRQARVKAADWLLFYAEKKKKYLTDREKIIESTSKEELALGGMPQKGQTSDITGTKGSKLADLNQIDSLLKLVEDMERELPWNLKIFLKLRREHRHSRAWVNQVQAGFAWEMAKAVNKRPEEVWIQSRSTFNDWWNTLVDILAVVAAKRGLL